MKRILLVLILCLLLTSCTGKDRGNTPPEKPDDVPVEVNGNDKEKDPEPEKKDETVPAITVKEKILVFDEEINYDFSQNVETVFGETGGNTAFSSVRNGDRITVTVTATGNNGLSASDSFEIVYEFTKDKNVLILGDSIVYGWLANGYSFADYLAQEYDFAKVVKAGYVDFRLSTYDDPKKWLIDAVKQHYNDAYDYDYVILQGGVNDVIYDTPMGEISEGRNPESFDPNTFTGGLETYLYTVTSKWPGAKIGYIITYYSKDYTERGLTWSYEDYKKYYDRIIEVLDKWNIDYLNLFSDDFSQLLKVDTNTYLPDKLHLNQEGHRLIGPYVYEWMKGLKRYS